MNARDVMSKRVVSVDPDTPLREIARLLLDKGSGDDRRRRGLFGRFCSVCHGEAAVGGGVVPDLRKSPYLPVDAWYHIALDGILKINGMAPFGAVLDRSKATAGWLIIVF